VVQFPPSVSDRQRSPTLGVLPPVAENAVLFACAAAKGLRSHSVPFLKADVTEFTYVVHTDLHSFGRLVLALGQLSWPARSN
jgi:hypothetical protein